MGQQHTGWVAFFQNHVLSPLQCVWFNRGESKNRHLVAEKLAAHAKDPKRIPLLVFPEGTCVNNEWVPGRLGACLLCMAPLFPCV